VVVYHAGRLTPGESGISWIYSRASSFGWSGVDLFFVLSGFLITGILADTKESANYFRAFYARRTLRIFPLYYLALTLLTFLPLGMFGLQMAPQYNQRWLWLYGVNLQIGLNNDWGAVPEYLTPFWSLCVEEQFYLLWPLLVYLTPRRRLAMLCWTAILAATAARYGAVWGDQFAAARVLTLYRMDALAAGGLLAVIVRTANFIPARCPSRASWVALASGTALIVLAIVHTTFNPDTPWVLTLGMTLLIVLYSSVLMLALTARPRSWVNRFFSTPPLVGLGKYSYAVYVFHYPITLALAFYFTLPEASHYSEQLAFAAMCLALSFGAALISWHFVEQPFHKLKSFFKYSPAVAEANPRSI
jgi:peptidoglycan/LPS O-acetylase OafA/YrhL